MQESRAQSKYFTNVDAGVVSIKPSQGPLRSSGTSLRKEGAASFRGQNLEPFFQAHGAHSHCHLHGVEITARLLFSMIFSHVEFDGQLRHGKSSAAEEKRK